MHGHNSYEKSDYTARSRTQRLARQCQLNCHVLIPAVQHAQSYQVTKMKRVHRTTFGKTLAQKSFTKQNKNTGSAWKGLKLKDRLCGISEARSTASWEPIGASQQAEVVETSWVTQDV